MKRYNGFFYIRNYFYLLIMGLLLYTMPARSAMNCQLASFPGGCKILVQATILKGCQISDIPLSMLGELNFGRYASVAQRTVTSSLNLSSLVSLECTPDIDFTMTIDGGQNYDGQYNMKSSEGRLIPYQLFSDSGLSNSIIANQPITIKSPENGGSILLPIYSKSQLTGTYPPGIYTDRLIINIAW